MLPTCLSVAAIDIFKALPRSRLSMSLKQEQIFTRLGRRERQLELVRVFSDTNELVCAH